MTNAEAIVVAAFNDEKPLGADALEASMDVPGERPPRFITVERVGGPSERHRDRPLLAIRCWSTSRWQASEDATAVAAWLRTLAATHPDVARVDVSSIYNNPDPASGHARYQITAQLVTT